MESQLPKIVAALQDKAVMKQGIYNATCEVFGKMKQYAEAIAMALTKHFKEVNPDVVIEFTEANDFEFQLKFSGDVLTFTMHTNVTTMLEEHIVLKSPYVQEDPSRGYFGSIMVYNFMADSIKYNRLGDLGYLMARMLLNKEGHFYIEGVRQLNFLFPDIAKNVISDALLLAFIEDAMLMAIDQDLVAPNYQDIQVVTLQIKQANQLVNSGSKVGFKNSAERREG